MFRQRADSTGQSSGLTKPEPGAAHIPEAWHPTAEVLLLQLESGDATLWSLALPDKKATPFGGVKSTLPIGAVVSPDGRWVAYSSNETGANRVYVQPFPRDRGTVPGVREGAGERPPRALVAGQQGADLQPSSGCLEAVKVTTQPTVALATRSTCRDRFKPALRKCDGRST